MAGPGWASGEHWKDCIGCGKKERGRKERREGEEGGRERIESWACNLMVGVALPGSTAFTFYFSPSMLKD